MNLNYFLKVINLSALLYFAVFLQISQAATSETITYTAKNESLEQVLKVVKRQTKYEVLGTKNLFTGSKPINIMANKMPIQKFLSLAFKNQPVNYKIVDQTILLIKSPDPVADVKEKDRNANSMAQQALVVTVLNRQNQPIAGANVTSNNKLIGMTNAEGVLSIPTPDIDTQFKIEMMGYITQTIQTKAGRYVYAINLIEERNEMDEVVVIGYGTSSKKDLTGAVSSIKGEVIQQTKTSSFLNSMQGRVAGLQLTTGSGEPGSASRVIIRGANSLTGNSDPLYVIDGVQINESDASVASSRFGRSAPRNPLSTINPMDIVSIDVLKDASATAIYGSKGANGVIIVTTRQGKEGTSVIAYDGNYGIANRANKIDMLNGEEWINYRKDWTLMPDGKRLQYGYFTDWLFFLNPTERDPGQLIPRDVYALPEFDWQQEMYRTAHTTQHSLSLTGGSTYTKYAGSVGYNREEGVLLNNDYSRFNGRIRLDHAKDRVSMSMGINSTYSVYNGAAQSGDGYNNMGILQTALISRPLVFENPLAVQTQGGWREPTKNLNHIDRVTTMPNTSANASFHYKVIEGLYIGSMVSGTIVPSRNTEFYGKETPWGHYLKGRAAVTNADWRGWANINSISYDKRFDNNSRLNVLGVFELNGSRSENYVVVKSDFGDETTGVYDLDKGVNTEQSTSGANLMRRMSYLSRINYTMSDKYIFTTSLRADGSDRFGEDNRWGYFPSAAFAWRLSEESFLKDLNVADQLKFRLSYGKVGNSNIPAFRYMARMGNSFYGDQLGLIPTSIPNSKLQWETTDQYNVGLDYSSRGGFLNITVDLYNKKTYDMLYEAIIPAQSGFKSQWQNLGEINNKGIEVTINTRNIRNDNFQWSSSLTLSSNKNKVIDIGNGLEEVPIGASSWSLSYIKINDVGRIRKGQPIGQMYGYQMDGIYQMDDFDGWLDKTGVLQPNDPNIVWQERSWVLKDGVVDPGNLGTARPGTLKFKNLDGSTDNKITEADKTIIGRSEPKLYGGIGNNFSYKNFDLSLFFTYSIGADIFNSTKFELEGGYPGEYYNITKDFWDNRWTLENPTNERPSYSDIGYYNSLATQPSSYYVENASYLRLQNASFSYALPYALSKRLGFSNMRVYYSGNNLLTITPYSGYAPDVDSGEPLLQGFDFIGYPRARTHVFGINVTF